MINVANKKDKNMNHIIKRKIRNCSNYTRNRTSASSVKHSVSSIFTTSKSDKKIKDMFKYINKKNVLINSTEVPSFISQNQKSHIQLKNNPTKNSNTSISDN